MSKPFVIGRLRPSLTEHLRQEGDRLRRKYGPNLGWRELRQVLKDREFVRYPCEIRFDCSPLLPGEFAYPLRKGPKLENGFVICVHPLYSDQLGEVIRLVLYQLVRVNCGDLASPEDAEIFGSHALGLSRADYYRSLCELAERLGLVQMPSAPVD